MNKYLDKVNSGLDLKEDIANSMISDEGAPKKSILGKVQEIMEKKAAKGDFLGTAVRRSGRVLHGGVELVGEAVGHLTGANVKKVIRQETKIPVQRAPFSRHVDIKERPASELHKFDKANDSEKLLRFKNSYGANSEKYRNLEAAINKKHASRVILGGAGAVGIAHHVDKKFQEHLDNARYEKTYGQAPY